MKLKNFCLSVAITALLAGSNSYASSHREAPFITKHPKVDATDFYMFTSYEKGRENFTTLIANYIPLQDAYGGPNYFTMDTNTLYEIHIDNNGDAIEDLTFQFEFNNELAGFTLPISSRGEEKHIGAIPTKCLVGDGKGIIGAWTTASLPQIRLLNPQANFAKPAANAGKWV
jgi:hypothetical protein